MIIRWLYDSILEEIRDTARLQLVTAEILRSHRFGHHLVVIDRKLAIFLNKLEISGEDKAMLNRLAGDYTQNGNIHLQAAVYIDIINSLTNEISRDPKSYSMSLGYVLNSRVLEPTTLLLENLHNDGWLYDEIFKYVATKNRLISFKYTGTHGGGDDIPNILSAVIGEGRIALTLIDSDAAAPSSRPKDKLSRLKQVSQSVNPEISHIQSLPVREIENLIPLEVILKLPCAANNSTNEVLLRIRDHEINNEHPLMDHFCLYFDYKVGIPIPRPGQLDDEETRWIRDKLRIGGIILGDEVVSGYGSTIVNQLRNANALTAAFHERIRHKDWVNRYLEFFSNLIWYFVSARRLVT
ncbi:hypothetical protein D3C80_924140 [compost metagenome]